MFNVEGGGESPGEKGAGGVQEAGVEGGGGEAGEIGKVRNIVQYFAIKEAGANDSTGTPLSHLSTPLTA